MNILKLIFERLNIQEPLSVQVFVNIDFHVLYFLCDFNKGVPLNPLEKATVSLLKVKGSLSIEELGRILGFKVIEGEDGIADPAHKDILNKILNQLSEKYYHISLDELNRYSLTRLGLEFFETFLKFNIEKAYEVELFYYPKLDDYNLYNSFNRHAISREFSSLTDIEEFKTLEFEQLFRLQRPDLISSNLNDFKFLRNYQLKKVSKAEVKIPLVVVYDPNFEKVSFTLEKDDKSLDYLIDYCEKDNSLFRNIIAECAFKILDETNQVIDSNLIGLIEDKWNWSVISQKQNVLFDKDFLLKYAHRLDWILLSQNESIKFDDDILNAFQDKWDWDALTMNKSIELNVSRLETLEGKWNWFLLSKTSRLSFTSKILERFYPNIIWEQLSSNESIKIDHHLLWQFKDLWSWNVKRDEFLPHSTKEINNYKDYVNFNNLVEKLDLDILLSEEFQSILANQKNRLVKFSLESIPTNEELITKLDQLELINWQSKRWDETITYTRWKWDGSEDSEYSIEKVEQGFFENPHIVWTSSLLIKFKDRVQYLDEKSYAVVTKKFSKELNFSFDEINALKDILDYDVLLFNPNISITVSFINSFSESINYTLLSSHYSVYDDVFLLEKFWDRFNWDVVISKREGLIPPSLYKMAASRINHSSYTERFKNYREFDAVYVKSLSEYLDWNIISSSQNTTLFQASFLQEFSHKFEWDLLSSNTAIRIERYKLELNKDYWNWALLSNNENAISHLDIYDFIWFTNRWDWSVISTVERTKTYLNQISNEIHSKDWKKLSQINQKKIIVEKFQSFPQIWWWKTLQFNPDIPFYEDLLSLFSDQDIWAEIINDTNRFSFDIENIYRYINLINWEAFTLTPRLNFDVDIIRRFRDYWNWELLSTNKAIQTNYDLVSEFREVLIWDNILETCDDNLDKRIIDLFRDEWLQPFIKIEKILNAFEGNIKDYFGIGEYISNYRFKQWLNEWLPTVNVLFQKLDKIPFYKKFGTKHLPKRFERAIRLIGNIFYQENSFINKHNEEFVEAELVNQFDFFNDITGVALDEQQRKAIIIDEDNNLVIAGAGSGKTMTIAGKVKYLIEQKNIIPDDILLITFTSKAREEMFDRAMRATGRRIQVETFHSWGLRIIQQVLGADQPGLPREDNSARGFLNKEFNRLLNDTRYKAILEEYFAYYLKPYKPLEEFKNQGEYIAYVKENNLSFKSVDVQTDGKVSLYKEVLKSQEEVEIANFLLLNGIKYEYEKPYKINTANENFIQYRPDFYLPEYDIYIEHFAFINENEEYPNWFRSDIRNKPNYRESANWKRKLHQEYKTTLIETYSHEKSRGVLKECLKLRLEEKGVKFNPISMENVWKIIEKYYMPEIRKFSDLLQTFITLLKQSRQSLDDIKNRASELNAFEKIRFEKFLECFEPIYLKYESNLKAQNSIDFSDMINLAINFVEQGRYKKFYKYIIVDEFQDTSINRAYLLKAIRNNNPDCKLFCVGDDWQSIYRFAGSDISLFVDFEEHFGYSNISKIETTYRFDKSIIELSGKFVQANPNQKRKTLNSIKPSDTISYQIIESENEAEDVKRILNIIYEQNNRQEKDILILGRYKSSFDAIKNSESFTLNNETLRFSETPSFNIKCLTVHKSKGLGADYVIILGCNGGKYGFPSELNDDPVLKLVLSESDSFPNGEERRLFYVAMTRTKEKLFMLTSANNKSKFILELQEYNSNNDGLSQCPACGNNTKMIRRINKTTGEGFYGCSNYPMCSYTSSF